MKETTKRNLSLILVFFLLALVVFFNFSWPALLKTIDLNDSLKFAKDEYARQTKSVQLAKQIVDRYKNLTNVNQMISLSLPKTDELYNVLVQLQRTSADSGLLIQNITIKMPTASSSQTSGTAAAKESSLIKPTQTINLDLSLIGTYESFKTWLNAVETNIRLMDVASINFTSVLSGEKSTTTNLFNYRVNLNVYYQP